MSIYEELGVKRVINAAFALTRLGGSTLSRKIVESMIDANKTWVWLWDLEEKAGKIIAELTGAEAAHVTAGCFASLVLSAAACMAGKDPDKMKKLPNTIGMKNEIITQRCLRDFMYDRSMTVAGGKLIEVGDERWSCRPEQIMAAINEKTAAIHHDVYAFQSFPNNENLVSLEEVIAIGNKHNIPIIVDAAGQTYPTDGLKKFVAMGADLVCYASKYFLGPNSAGIVIGRKDLVEAVALHNFIGQEGAHIPQQPGFYRSIGRGYKLDRQEIVAVVIALKSWLQMDHMKERIQPALKRRRYILDVLQAASNVEIKRFPMIGDIWYHIIGLQIFLENKNPAEVVKALMEGDPSIWVLRHDQNTILVNTLFLADGEEKILAKRLKSVLSSTNQK